MKVLSMAWTIYDSRIRYFCKNCTGAGMVVKNICEYIGRKHQSYLFVGRHQLPAMKLGNIWIVDTSIVEYDCNMELDSGERHLRVMTKAFSKAIDEIEPEIVNFHGIGILMQRCINICREKKIPYVYTEHLYISIWRSIEKYERTVEWEKQLYKLPDLHIITVSTGMKSRILEDFPMIDRNNISVITNGTDFRADIVQSNLKKDYQLNDKKILLCVGTLLVRKNQMQLVRAFMLLKKEIRENLCIIFCGNDGMDGRLQSAIRENNLGDRLIYVGPQSSDDMKKYYSIADGLIMPSLAEGLSIAVLEAIAYGLPIVMFSDSECAEDMNDKRVVSFANERTDESLGRAILDWYTKKWDREYIRNFSGKFTMERVAQDYIKYYEDVLRRKQECI